ncbi:hypothetical protein MMC30_008681 [Trapelia coarctata]|nr:hypothetical protein [Trapelia coarctata]
MKQRFSSLDVKVIAHELSKSLCTLRLSNVYDLSSRIFLLKFAKPNHREQMVIDSGFRCHLTKFARTTAAAPSAFVTRLRKFLRTRRLTSVSQVGTDRIIDFQFSDGQYRLFLEFYAGGNIVITDKELNILALLRIVSEGEGQEELRVGLKYSLENRQNYGGVPPLTRERVREGLRHALERTADEAAVPTKKGKKKSGDALRKALAVTLTEFPPMLIDHALSVTGFDPSTPVDNVAKDDSILERLMLVLEEANTIIAKITASETTNGYIIAKVVHKRAVDISEDQSGRTLEGADKNESVMYEDFHPFRPRKSEGVPDTKIIEIAGFNATVDEFFSSIEAQKLELRLTEREENARRKLETARNDHQKRVGGLQLVQEMNIRKAEAIEANLQRVQEAITAINSLIAQGMDWSEIARLIEMEQKGNNPVAEMIKLPLKLYENTATLLLAEADFEDVEDFEGDETGSDVSDSENENHKPSKFSRPSKPADKRLAVDVHLALSPWSNARQYYDQKRSAAVKEKKTLQSSEKALKNTERKVNADLKRGLKQEKEVLRPVRKLFWFEKFYYFISSEGYLVLAGRDAQQNEILYKKYLKKGDVYVHADLHGAASVIIKNKSAMLDSPIPPSTLSQAGTMAVSSSTAWESKAMMAAWWVNADQVSKTAPTGEYLTTGSFIIKGKKNFLPPAHLLLGFGVMFRVSEESKAKHLKHRLRDEHLEIIKHSSQTQEHNRVNAGGLHGVEPNKSDEEYESDGGAPLDVDRTKSQESSDAEPEHEPDLELGGNEDGEKDRYENPLQSSGRPVAAEEISQQSVEQESEDAKDDKPSLMEKEKDQDSASEDSELDPEIEAPPTKADSIAHQPSPATSGIRHLSAKERRLLRNSQTPSQSSTNPPSDAESSSAHLPSTPSSTAPNPLNQPRVRGKHGQRARQKTKYAHQDEEDRTLAMRLLGSKAGQERSSSEATSKAAREAEFAAQKERRREQHLKSQQAGKESEELRRLNLEEGIETLDEEEVAEMGTLENFVGTPLPGDEILDVLVVCGPWDAMGGRLRWRVKIQPGTAKKGKAVREILGAWRQGIIDREKRKRPGAGEEEEGEDQVGRREGELIKGLREVEVLGVVPVGKCRVMVGGGEKSRGAGVAGKGKRGGRGSKKSR